jgi:purine-cytosine permease-like protein
VSELARDVEHDYSTGEHGVVPRDQRRPLSSFTGLWVSLLAGFAELNLGFEFHYFQYSLGEAVITGLLAALCYLAYALPAAYLGSSTGQTYALLTRSIFGRVGSVLVSLVLIGRAAGWIAVNSTMLAGLYRELFGWGHLPVISVLAAVVGAGTALLGFTGISAFAKYVAAPLMTVLALFLVIKGAHDVDHHVVAPAISTFTYSSGGPIDLRIVALAVGSVTWGTEPDIWRYGRPTFGWPLLPYALALTLGLELLVAGGWLIADLGGQGVGDYQANFHAIVTHALFGALWLGGVLATVLAIAVNGGLYYQLVNAGQNLVGQVRGWRRWHTVLLAAVVAAAATWWFSSSFWTGFNFTVQAEWVSITLPAAGVVMLVDHFVLPRVSRLRRPVEPVPSWRQAGTANWPGILAVLLADLFGAWEGGHLPHQLDPPNLGPVAPEGWLLAGLLYLGFALIAAKRPTGKTLLGYRRDARAPEGAEQEEAAARA